MDNIFAKIQSTLLLPTKLREDAVNFLMYCNKEYIDIMINAPYIDHTDQIIATREYLNFEMSNTNHTRQLQKYHNTDDTCLDFLDVV